MSWVKRGGQRYYYRSVRRGKGVKSVYFGDGPAALLVAALDAEVAAERAARMAARAENRKRGEAIEEAGKPLTEVVAALCDACLLLSGYHEDHNLKWRLTRTRRPEMSQGKASESALNRASERAVEKAGETSGADATGATSGAVATGATSGAVATGATSGADATGATSGADAMGATSGADATGETSGADATGATGRADAETVGSRREVAAIISQGHALGEALRSGLAPEAVTDFLELIQRVDHARPSRADLVNLEWSLARHPGIWRVVADYGRSAIEAMIEQLDGPPAARLAFLRAAEELRAGAAGAGSSAIEIAIAEQIAVCWVRLRIYDVWLTRATGQDDEQVIRFWDEQVKNAQRRFLEACHELAAIRQMALRTPQIMQINVGAQQVNVAQAGEDRAPGAQEIAPEQHC